MEVLSASRLTVRLGALRRNYRQISEFVGKPAGAAVKANAYGLGAIPVAKALWDSGCREFFVAHLAEGIEIRQALPSANISVFNGAMPGTIDDLVAHQLIPMTISLAQIELWQSAARAAGTTLRMGLHFDTGMNRTGITATETQHLIANPNLVSGLEICHVMTHMACADDRSSSQPEAQLNRFKAVLPHFPQGIVSMANSAGVFRGEEFHFDLVRPGISIYGGAPTTGNPNPMEQTVVLEAPIIHVKDVTPGETVGYGATYQVTKPERHAAVTVGYADGYLRSKSNSGKVSIAGHKCPIVGRVSMDLTIIDVSNVPADLIYLGAPVEMIGDHRPIDDVAADAGTIANELLTELGTRYNLIYSED